MGKFIDITGQKFGRLTALKPSQKRDATGGVFWHCVCDCGQFCEVNGTSLKRGGTKSCGRIKKSYGEDLIQTILTQSNIHFTQEQTSDDCILPSGKKARFDFYIENQYLVEFDGKQHFDPNAGQGNEKLEEIQKRDQSKNEYCHKKNIPLYRIPYIEVDNLKTVDDILNKKYLI